METITNSRELFIIEIIINYLQSAYPNIYGDKEIIRKYIQYNKLNNKKHLSEDNKDIKFTTEENEKLEELNVYFFGNEDGSSSFYSDLPGNYLMTIRTIKQLISTNNKSIQEAISSIYSLFQNKEITEDSQALNYYLNEIIIPSLLISLDGNYINEKIDTKISRDEYKFDKYKEIEIEEKRKIEKKEREKREEEKKIEEKEKKLIKEKKDKRLEDEKLSEKIKIDIEKNQEKNKRESDTKKRNDIKKLKKDFDDTYQKFLLEMNLNIKDPILKKILEGINDYSQCKDKLRTQTDETIKKKLVKYCELLKIKKDINDTNDINEITKLQKMFNSKIKEFFESDKLYEDPKLKDDKTYIKKEINEMDIFFNKNYSEYDRILAIQKNIEIDAKKEFKIGELCKIIIEFQLLKNDILINELYVKNIDFKKYMDQLIYYFTILKICFRYCNNKEIFILIINHLLIDKEEYFTINPKISELYAELINKISSIKEDDATDDEKECLFYNISKELWKFYNLKTFENDTEIFDLNIFNKVITGEGNILDKITNFQENAKICQQYFFQELTPTNDMKTLYLYLYKKYEKILFQINPKINRNIKTDKNNYDILIKKILSEINKISKKSLKNEEALKNLKQYNDYIKSIYSYEKFTTKYLENYDINLIKAHYNKIYINKF